MNKTIGTIFMLIPLVLAVICMSLGLFVYFTGLYPTRVLPGLVLFFLSAICIALFCTASVIIPQLTGTFNGFKKVFFPVLGYCAAAITFILGFMQIVISTTSETYVAGHVMCGVALVAACVSTVATASVKFHLIPKNSKQTPDYKPDDAFGLGASSVLKAIPMIISLLAWIWTYILISKAGSDVKYLVAAFLMLGLSCICTGLVGLVWSIVNQVNNKYNRYEKYLWPLLVIIMGTLALILGISIVVSNPEPALLAPGWVLMGLGLICYSISSKIILLAAVWRNTYPLANRIPLIPIFTALICLFTAAFLFVGTSRNPNLFVPARVMVGLGAICFCLFSIVSILESGTSKKE